MAKIVIVDDEKGPRDLQQRILQKEHEIKCFENGFQAILFVDENKSNIDLVLADLQSPFVNGADLIRALKYDIGYNGKTILLSGAYASLEDIKKDNAVDYGKIPCDDYIYKPFDIDVYRAKINQILNKK